MKITILGAGNTGKANAVFLTQHGHQVMLYDRSLARLKPIEEKGITATGCIEGLFHIPATTALSTAVKGSDLILVCTVASGHRPIAAALHGLLEPGQNILITNGCWGAVEFEQSLGKEAAIKDCLISETNGQLILCNSPSSDSIYLKTIKKQILFSCTDPTKNQSLLEYFHPLFPQLYPAPSVLYTSLNNSNPISHGPLALFNLTRMENGEDFLLFGTGATPRVTRFMEKIDQERVNVVRACGIDAPTQLDMLNAAWPQKQKSLYDVFHNTAAYSVTKGPTTLEHRYLSEDLPYGLVPYIHLGQKLGIETPCLCTLVQIISLYMETDYLSMGPCLENLNFSFYM